ncbi:MAG: glycoside hydrolase family 99-like domain-containing protein, partial [Desulfovibrio sp.]|nr:glycoside hydrolase family 99-like domain-containing protein [Desulfovibrio sp.]
MRLYMIVKYLFLYAVAKLRYGLGQISRKQYHTVRSMSKYYLHVNYTALENYSYYALNQQERWKNDFIQLTEAPYQRQERDTRVIAFYLPQYYEFKLNNDWYGKGFTEWTNCTKAMPQFPGHYQPHLPYDVGYYSLNNSDVMHRQAELARHSGVYGWCYYYYWFHGKRMMEKPIFNFLKDKTIDMPFCLAWTNDNWMKNWSSSRDDDVVREMYYDASIVNDDADHFLPDIIDFFNDHRYIRIDGKPLLIIFRYGYKNFKNFMYELRESYRKKCSTEIYTMLIRNHVDADVDPASLYADAMLEFPPYRCNIKKISN